MFHLDFQILVPDRTKKPAFGSQITKKNENTHSAKWLLFLLVSHPVFHCKSEDSALSCCDRR